MSNVIQFPQKKPDAYIGYDAWSDPFFVHMTAMSTPKREIDYTKDEMDAALLRLEDVQDRASKRLEKTLSRLETVLDTFEDLTKAPFDIQAEYMEHCAEEAIRQARDLRRKLED